MDTHATGQEKNDAPANLTVSESTCAKLINEQVNFTSQIFTKVFTQRRLLNEATIVEVHGDSI